ncbi:RagB/SusD family nutrient uptake outer membrane protein [Fodinibius sp. Rm-B-1B1-1]|uniref:RagB/SusD family nutrient uptake outer membrane protein n=1 Tax=Fodinibius alkaliphilus TaxID=3140241 RepID=UPI00315AB509
MKNKLLLSIFAICMLVVTSCSDLLDVEPKQSIDADQALNTPQKVEAAVIGAYDDLSSVDLLGGTVIYGSDLLGDDGSVTWFGTFSQPDELWSKNILTDNSFVRDVWLQGYETIDATNNALSALDVIEDSDMRNRVEGQAKLIRGIVYFELVRLFGRDWSDGDPSQNPGVPIALEPTRDFDNPPTSRSSVEDVYIQVINDLTDAKALLPSNIEIDNTVLGNTYVASAYLSRVYLQQREYEDAGLEAGRVINSGNYSLTPLVSGAFNNPTNSTEDVFAVQVSDQDGANDMNTFYAGSQYSGREDIELTGYFDLFTGLFDSDDDTRDDFIHFGASFGGPLTSKWTNFRNGNINIVRLAEMYLTRGEASFRTGNDINGFPAEDDFNMVRSRAGQEDIDATDIDLDYIFTERYIELAFEGHVLHDTKRFERSASGIPWNDPSLIFPIPQREIDASGGELEQNEGYGS